MKRTERQHLKHRPLQEAVLKAHTWALENQRSLVVAVATVAVVAVGVAGYMAWKRGVENEARAMLAAAMVIDEARVMPPGPPAGTTNDPTAVGGQPPGTYATEKEKLDASLPKFLAAADAFPGTQTERTARYHAATNLVALGRFDEAATQYDRVIAAGEGVLARMARLGKAEAQLRAAQYDPAIATFKELAEQTDGPLPVDALLMELARAYRLAGKAEDARKTLDQVVEKHADSPFAAEARAEIAKMKG